MTRKGWGRTDKLFESLTARERVRQIHIAERDGTREDPAIRKMMPRWQGGEFNDLIGQMNAMNTILGTVAVDTRAQADLMFHKLQLVIAHQKWGEERATADEKIGDSDWRSEPGPGNPEGVVPGSGSVDTLVAFDELSEVDQITRGNIDIVCGMVGPLLAQVGVIETLTKELADTLDVGEGVEVDVVEVVKDARSLLEVTARSVNILFDGDIDLEPEPDSVFMQMMREALQLYRGLYRVR